MEPYKVLIVEDEPKVAEFLYKGLEENGFVPTIAYDGYLGRTFTYSNTYDVIILDVNMPHVNGVELCKEIRERGDITPVMMLTALGRTDDKLQAFDAGADDYMVKPFEFAELVARLKVIIKRNRRAGFDTNKIKIGDLEINFDTHMVKRKDKDILLTAKEFALLEYLARNKGKVVSKADIAEKVWDRGFDSGTNVIEVYINFLRKKVDSEFPVKLIHTRPGFGYTIKADAVE